MPAALVLRKPRKKIAQRQLELRARLWPGLHDGFIWQRLKHDGFVTMPRTMPLILSIMDDLSQGQPVSSTYLELWARSYDEAVVTLAKSREMAFHAGFTGQRGERTWRGRMRILQDLGFIDIKEGASGPMSYALIFNPYLVIRRLKEQGQPVRQDKYHALMERAAEISAGDFEMADPWNPPPPPPAIPPAPVTNPLPPEFMALTGVALSQPQAPPGLPPASAAMPADPTKPKAEKT